MGIKMLHTKFLQEIPMLENHMGECKIDQYYNVIIDLKEIGEVVYLTEMAEGRVC